MTGHSWEPVDLLALSSQPPVEPSIDGIVYPGEVHVFSGEPGAMKTWAALALCADELRLGSCVFWIDHEMGPRRTLERLRAVGLAEEAIRRLVYFAPSEALRGSLLEDVHALVAARQPSLVVIDAFSGALVLHGLNQDSAADVETFYAGVVSVLRESGAAVVILDHVTKNSEARGKFSIGSGRKIGAADVHLGFEVVAPFGRGQCGRAKLVTHKDRDGYLAKAAELVLASDPDSGLVTYTFQALESRSVGEDVTPFRPTGLMEKVSRFVERCSDEDHDPPSRNQVERDVKGKRAYLRLAVSLLLEEGYLSEQDGPRRARLLLPERPYREADDATSPDFAPLRPDLAGGEVHRPRPTSPTPSKGGEVGGAKSSAANRATSPPDRRDLGQCPVSSDQIIRDDAFNLDPDDDGHTLRESAPPRRPPWA